MTRGLWLLRTAYRLSLFDAYLMARSAARLFSTHPMDADRIDKTQKEIQRILPSKPDRQDDRNERPTIKRRDLME
jgi:hypothetical protein